MNTFTVLFIIIIICVGGAELSVEDWRDSSFRVPCVQMSLCSISGEVETRRLGTQPDSI